MENIPKVAPNGPPKSKKHKSAKEATDVKLTVSAPGLKNTVVPNGPPEDQNYKTKVVLKGNLTKTGLTEESIFEAWNTGASTAGSSNDYETAQRQGYIDPGTNKKLTLNHHALHKAYQEAYEKVQSEKPPPSYHDVKMKAPPCLGRTIAAVKLCERVLNKSWVKVTTA